MVVQLAVLQRVYDAMQGSQASRKTDVLDDKLDTDSRLFFIDAFEMPLWHWSPERATFEKCAVRDSIKNLFVSQLSFNRVSRKLTVSGSPESRVLAMRDRLNLIKQTIMRNDNFSPRPLAGVNREKFLRVSYCTALVLNLLMMPPSFHQLKTS